MNTQRVTGDAAQILIHLARESWSVPPPDEVVSVRERTPREYLASRRIRWIIASLLLAVVISCLGMLAVDASTASPSPPEADLIVAWLVLFGATLLVMALAWRLYRAATELALGPLDAPARAFRAEPAALVLEAPEGGARRLDLGALVRCDVVGHRTKNGWHLASLTLDDGAGPIDLRAAWLPSERILVALAERLLRTGAVVVALALALSSGGCADDGALALLTASYRPASALSTARASAEEPSPSVDYPPVSE